MPAPDGLDQLRRLVALLEAGQPIPTALHRWLLESGRRILGGESPADALGLRVAPGAWSSTPGRAWRYRQRDRAITRLFTLASGCQSDRAAAVLEWSDGTRTPPPAAVPLIAEINSAGLALPDIRRVVEIATSSRARDVTQPPAVGSVNAG